VKLTGRYFELTDRRTTARGASPEPMVISVAKRVVPSAVRRNTVKRIVREAWRASLRAQPAGRPGNNGLLIRLKTYPGRGRRPSPGGKARPDLNTRGDGTKAMQRSMKVSVYSDSQVQSAEISLAAVKRLLRADADQLIGAALKPRRASPDRRKASGPSR
jgi:hypothetical protein